MTTNTSTSPTQKPENGFLNILFNILIPVLILNKGGKYIDPFWALIIALAFPLSYGIYDIVQRRKINAFSILGLLNVGITGSLALSGKQGLWFSLKEAAFPLLIGLFVLGSAFTRKPFIQTLLMNPSVMNTDLIEEKLALRNKQAEFANHLKKATIWLSVSFLFSAICNYVLAERIFLPINDALSAVEKNAILNEQIAQMTTWSMAVIMVPSIFFLMGIFWYLLKGIQNFSGLPTDDIILQK